MFELTTVEYDPCWFAVPAGRRKFPFSLRCITPAFCELRAEAWGREHGENVNLSEIRRAFEIRLEVVDRTQLDVKRWSVILDPDGLRLTPESVHARVLRAVDEPWISYCVTWTFDPERFDQVRRPLTVDLFRGSDRARFRFPREMR